MTGLLEAESPLQMNAPFAGVMRRHTAHILTTGRHARAPVHYEQSQQSNLVSGFRNEIIASVSPETSA